jgi:hypothetical protein
MKIKSVLASVAACAIAISAMAVSVSADALMSKKGNEKNSENYSVPLDGIDVTKIDKIVADIALDSDYVNGCIGFNEGGAWVNHGPNGANQFEVNASGEVVLSGLAGKVDEGTTMEVQFWWVNDVSEGNPGTATLNSVKLYDATGAELGGNAPAETESTAAATTTSAAAATTTTSAAAGTTTTAAATTTTSGAAQPAGDAGVAVVAATLALAGAAAFVARKKD